MHRKLINVYNTEFLFESNYFYAILSNLKVLQNFCRIIDTLFRHEAAAIKLSKYKTHTAILSSFVNTIKLKSFCPFFQRAFH